MSTAQFGYDKMPKLNNKHREIIRLSVMGWKGNDIADHLGMHRVSVYCILRSPLAQMEIERLQQQANEIVSNLPFRIEQERKLRTIATEAVDVNRNLMNNDRMDPKVRSRISMHFQDRIIFDKTENDKPDNYRAILRKLDEVASQIKNGETIEAHVPGDPIENGEIVQPVSPSNNGINREGREKGPTVSDLLASIRGNQEEAEDEALEIVKFDKRFKT